jgi:hypothetical protein
MTANARRLRLTDLPVLAFHSRRVYPNQAITLEHAGAPDAAHPNRWRLLRTAVWPGRRRRIWISRDGSTLLGVIALRRRTGRSAWEIDTLITATSNDAFLLDLLDRAVATAGADGAHRLFLRLATNSPALSVAQNHGFIAIAPETLYSTPLSAQRVAPTAPPPTARRRVRADDHNLFQLYCQVTPHEARWQTALSPAEWRAAQEPLGPDGKEWVLPAVTATTGPNQHPPAGLGALARLALHNGARTISLLAQEGAETAAAALDTALAAAHVSSGRQVTLLIPEYATAAHRAAHQRGMHAIGEYLMLVRPIAQRVRRLEVADQAVEGSARSVLS